MNRGVFPTYRKNGTYPHDYQTIGGMTLRDYFAAKAMEAIIAKSPFLHDPENHEVYLKTAAGAYDYADAMLTERVLGATHG